MIKDNSKFNKTDMLLVLIILILIIVNIILYVKNFIQPKQENVSQTNTQTNQTSNNKQSEESEEIIVPKNNEELIEKLSTQNERERMEYYCGIFFKHIENGEYDEAYNLLYTEFKTKYFPTVEEFEEYAKKTYPSDCGLQYDDITRQGDIYVLKLNILDILGSKNDSKSQRIVVKEKNYNDFVISFQVI